MTPQNANGIDAAKHVVLSTTVAMSFAHWGAIPSWLVGLGWRVSMIASDSPKPSERLDGVEYRVIRMQRRISPMSDSLALLRWVYTLARLRPDAVIAATPKAGFLSMIAARFCRVPVRQFHVWGCRWDGSRGVSASLARLGDRAACACSTDVVAVSCGVRTLLGRGCVDAARVRVLGSGGSKGVDLQKFLPREAIGHDGPPTIGFVGRLAHDKGLAWLPALLRSVQERIPAARLVLAGDPDPADPACSATMHALRNTPGVTMLGSVHDMPAFYRGIDVLCFPSVREGLPNAVIEAAACGVPTVAWNATGLPDAIVNNETGFLVPIGDVAAMTERLVTILSSDAERSRLSRSARAFVERSFEANHVQGLFVRDLAVLLGD